MQTITTRHGMIPVAQAPATYPDGSLRACLPAGPCVLNTPVGQLVPQFTARELRKKEVRPITFHPDGTLQALPLESQRVIPSAAGSIPAELLTFHADGSLSRVFPLNGRLSGYWTQEDEAELARPVTLLTPAGILTTTLIGAAFHPSGTIRSLTFWPGQTVSINTPAGMVDTRIGVSFHPDGQIRSVEPARPAAVETPAGEILAHDPDALGINGDSNSLAFHPDGTVSRVITIRTRLTAISPDGRLATFAPTQRESLCGDGEREMIPMSIQFTPDAVIITQAENAPPVHIPLEGHVFFTAPWLSGLAGGLPDLRCTIC
ncbi:hypothetical protein GKC30_10100 [Pseudodesulfovibrio sp. F-1]|uniref:Uncharacterized protein n=1 Tax=Pseudodesulfovibrio alkaliphilus TaxID=2661613 RepID=A0A7K1KPG6_9BACT|nr:hypothetical protein [Pseudodesulfovibrio alkaliphilus]MUM77986.1 hypothetical protein [Pseudodesulfovibrio alkaliphilus]